MTKYINDENNIICGVNMIDQNVMRVLSEHSFNRTNYLTYINEMDKMYDVELLATLYASMQLQRENLELMLKVLREHGEYLSTLTFTTKIIIEKYNNNTEKEAEYYVYPQVTPAIPDGDKAAFAKAGTWFKDETMAMAFAEILKNSYHGEIVKVLV